MTAPIKAEQQVAVALKALSVLTDGEIISVALRALAHVGSRMKVTIGFPDEPEQQFGYHCPVCSHRPPFTVGHVDTCPNRKP